MASPEKKAKHTRKDGRRCRREEPIDSDAPAEGNRRVITELRPNDVLYGRTAATVNYQGNLHFRTIVNRRKQEYMGTGRHKQKDAIAREIVDTIGQSGGRFLRLIESDQELATLGIPAGVKAFYLASEDNALNKVKQALREASAKSTKAGTGNEKASAVPAQSEQDRGLQNNETLMNIVVSVPLNPSVAPISGESLTRSALLNTSSASADPLSLLRQQMAIDAAHRQQQQYQLAELNQQQQRLNQLAAATGLLQPTQQPTVSLPQQQIEAFGSTANLPSRNTGSSNDGMTLYLQQEEINRRIVDLTHQRQLVHPQDLEIQRWQHQLRQLQQLEQLEGQTPSSSLLLQHPLMNSTMGGGTVLPSPYGSAAATLQSFVVAQQQQQLRSAVAALQQQQEQQQQLMILDATTRILSTQNSNLGNTVDPISRLTGTSSISAMRGRPLGLMDPEEDMSRQQQPATINVTSLNPTSNGHQHPSMSTNLAGVGPVSQTPGAHALYSNVSATNHGYQRSLSSASNASSSEDEDHEPSKRHRSSNQST